MKYLLVLMVLAAAAMGWVDDNGYDSSVPAGPPPVGDDAVSLTLINTFTVPTASHILGMNTQWGTEQFGMVDNTSDFIRGIAFDSGAQVWTIPINYGGTMANFGTAHSWPTPYGWYLNAWSDASMHYYSGSSWSVPFANPAGTAGRGMSSEGTNNYIWESNSSTSLFRISSSGSAVSHSVSVPNQMSGVAAFEYGSGWGVAVTFYNTNSIYFFEYTGSSLVLLGNATPPGISVSSGLGLTWCDVRDHFFFAYSSGSSYNVSEFDYAITSLAQDTWGGIKAQF
jgi:hypothetical protein